MSCISACIALYPVSAGIGVAFALNDTRGLDEKLTETLAAMRADGTLKQIVGKYLPDPEKYLEVDALEP